jgi:cytochrome c-type biogenesis protein CcmH
MSKNDLATIALRVLLTAALLASFTPSLAEETRPALDPVLESRVTDLAYKLRCLVCENQSIAESNAPLAADLREQVREQLRAGKNEAEVIAWLTGRYGDYVLYQPPLKRSTLLLWSGPALLLILSAGGFLWNLQRRRRELADRPPLSATDRARARALLAGENSPQTSEAERVRN